MKKIRSYSLLELMVVMVMSIMTIGFAYQGYLIFFRQLTGFKSSIEANASFSTLDRLLYSDIADSKEVRKDKLGLRCIFKDHTVLYEWNTGTIVRKQNHLIDSFYFEVSNSKLSFEQKEVSENELLNEVRFEGNFKGDSVELYYNKEYGAEVFVNSTREKYEY